MNAPTPGPVEQVLAQEPKRDAYFTPTAAKGYSRLKPDSTDRVGPSNPQLSNDPGEQWMVRSSWTPWIGHELDAMVRQRQDRSLAPHATGATETWGVTLSAIAINSEGAWLLAGTTSETDINKDTVIVYNGDRVVAREGDPIDLNGDGLFNDDVFINSFQAFDMRLTDQLEVYFLATLRNGAGTGGAGSRRVSAACRRSRRQSEGRDRCDSS